MEKISDMPNLGVKIEEALRKISIETPEQLKSCGSKAALARIAASGGDVCINRLYALEAAILGVPKKMLSEATKTELREYFRAFR